MYMRIIDGKWYANIRSRKNWKKKVTVSLDAYANEKRKATVNLGKVLADIERGIDPTSARKNVDKLVLVGRVTERARGILDTHIYPFFEKYKPREVDKILIEKYISTVMV